MDELSQYTMMAMGLLQQQWMQNAFTAFAHPNTMQAQMMAYNPWTSQAQQLNPMIPSATAGTNAAVTGQPDAPPGSNIAENPRPETSTSVGDHRETPSKTECKFGRRCTRKGCWFLHPRGRYMDRSDEQSRSRARTRSPGRKHEAINRSPSTPRPSVRRCLDGKLDSAWGSDDSPVAAPESQLDEPKPPSDSASKPHHLLRDTPVPWPRVISSSGKLKDVKMMDMAGHCTSSILTSHAWRSR